MKHALLHGHPEDRDHARWPSRRPRDERGDVDSGRPYVVCPTVHPDESTACSESSFIRTSERDATEAAQSSCSRASRAGDAVLRLSVYVSEHRIRQDQHGTPSSACPSIAEDRHCDARHMPCLAHRTIHRQVRTDSPASPPVRTPINYSKTRATDLQDGTPFYGRGDAAEDAHELKGRRCRSNLLRTLAGIRSVRSEQQEYACDSAHTDTAAKYPDRAVQGPPGLPVDR